MISSPTKTPATIPCHYQSQVAVVVGGWTMVTADLPSTRFDPIETRAGVGSATIVPHATRAACARPRLKSSADCRDTGSNPESNFCAPAPRDGPTLASHQHGSVAHPKRTIDPHHSRPTAIDRRVSKPRRGRDIPRVVVGVVVDARPVA